MLKLHLATILVTILVTIPGQVLAYRAFSTANRATNDDPYSYGPYTYTCYCKKVDSREDCYGPYKGSKRFYQDGMCCKVKCNLASRDVEARLKRIIKHKLNGYKEVDMEMCQETYEVPAKSCCEVEFNEWTLGLHIKKAISKPGLPPDGYKTLPSFEVDDITGGGEAEQPWSADDVRYLVTTLKREYPKAKLHCNKYMHKWHMRGQQACKLFEKKPLLSSGCCCPLADVGHAKQCFRVAGASKERVIQQEHWITKYEYFEYKYGRQRRMEFAEDVPHDNIKDQDANMPAELVDADPKENELPEFAVNGKKWTWMKVEDQYASTCLKRIKKKPYIEEIRTPTGEFENYKQRYFDKSCPEVQYTRICPPGEGLYMKKNIPDGKCLWSARGENTEEMQLKFKPQYPSLCPRGYTFGDSEWPGVDSAICQCSSRTITWFKWGLKQNGTICDFD